MRLPTALSLGVEQIAKSIEQLQKGAPTPPAAAPDNASPLFDSSAQQARNSDGFSTKTDLRSRYATQLQGTSAPVAQQKSTQPQLKLFQKDSFQAFARPPLALKAPQLPKQPAFFRV